MEEDLILRQQFSISKPRLFSLLSTPAYMEQWLSPAKEISLKVTLHEFKDGGKYQLNYTTPDGNSIIAEGIFIQIDPSDIISFTWEWLPPDVHAGIPTIVTWRLIEKGKNTELTIIHGKIQDKSFYERHKEGWQGSINQLMNLEDKIK